MSYFAKGFFGLPLHCVGIYWTKVIFRGRGLPNIWREELVASVLTKANWIGAFHVPSGPVLLREPFVTGGHIVEICCLTLTKVDVTLLSFLGYSREGEGNGRQETC